jgi:hypothetical protein
MPAPFPVLLSISFCSGSIDAISARGAADSLNKFGECRGECQCERIQLTANSLGHLQFVTNQVLSSALTVGDAPQHCVQYLSAE